MVSSIRFDPEPLLVLANRIGAASNDLARDAIEVQYLLSELDNCWSGDAIRTTIIDAQDDIDYCKKLSDTLNEISSVLRQISESALDVEDTIASQISQSLPNASK